jgi:uncharacterized protein
VSVSDVDVRENKDLRRYEVVVGEEVAGFAAYRVRDGLTVITHSEVAPRYRGQGLANQLAAGTLDLLRASGATVVPACPFFAKYVSEHHEWDDILAD